jgi:hypothetical protein
MNLSDRDRVCSTTIIIIMSANIGVVRHAGSIYIVPKTPFETDERLYDRAWFCAKKGDVTPVTISDSHKYVNEKYFNMKYKDGNRS